MVSVATKAGTDADITKLNPQQLAELGKAIESEVQVLNQSYTQLVQAVRKFKESSGVIAYLDQRKQNKEVMVPMTSSLYVPGVLADDNVMVECGAGYYMEKNLKEANEYCDRKADAMNKNVAKVGEYMQIKKEHMNRVQVEYTKRMQELARI